jgi:signal transduction histidine kinase
VSGASTAGAEAPLRVLLLEDSDLDAELISASLASTGMAHEIERTMDREGFEAAARRGAVDIILADYVLPAFDGVAALAIAQRHCADVPFVFVSGTLGEDVAVEALKNGAVDYVTKQRLDRLPRTIIRALSERKARIARREAEQALRELNATLEQRVNERTAALERANRELTKEIREREKAEGALRQAQRLEAVGQLTSGVAHDFNNLLTVILGNLRHLERAISDSGLRRRIDMMRIAAERGATLTGQLLAFSRRQRLEPVALDLNDTVRDMRDLLTSTMGGTIPVDMALSERLWRAKVDPTQMELVILNLAINARDAMQVGGRLVVSTANVVRSEPMQPEEPPAGEYATVTVMDSGEGMSQEVRTRAFEPFFTTKGPSRGSSLGLAQVHGFAKQSGGGVAIDTAPGRGTSVTVFLPRAEHVASGRAAPQEATPRPVEGRPLLLVVDDDAAVREVTAGTLTELGYEILEASSGAEALDALQQADGLVDLLLVDFAMPGMNGLQVAREARRIKPDLPIVFLTGYAESNLTQIVGEERTVQKPFGDEELVRKISAALAAAQERRDPVRS